jgi:hypothetical protein
MQVLPDNICSTLMLASSGVRLRLADQGTTMELQVFGYGGDIFDYLRLMLFDRGNKENWDPGLEDTMLYRYRWSLTPKLTFLGLDFCLTFART